MPQLRISSPHRTRKTPSAKGKSLAATEEILPEAAEITLKQEKEVLDDRHARKIAARLGVTMIGTVGILMKAKRHGNITAVKPLIEQLEKHNFYISEALKHEALRLAGE
ncbi:DUF3368 domain-containing protein [Candidatus Electrothrix sp.]|uniref:DUF3368 domain-containing protein n=1 Tax=Candidatus Electrothrix sp. TaxID=2170559 RepID=UPI0040564587